MSKGWKNDTKRHQIAGYRAFSTTSTSTPSPSNMTIPAVPLSYGSFNARQTKMTYTRNKTTRKSYSRSDDQPYYINIEGERFINLKSRKVKSEIFQKLRKDKRFRRVHFNPRAVVFNFKYETPDGKEFWKGAYYSIKGNKVYMGVYITDPKTHRRMKVSSNLSRMLNVLYRSTDEFIDYLYETLTTTYTMARKKGFHLEDKSLTTPLN